MGKPHATHPHKGGKRRLQGSITHVKLPFRLLWRPTHFAPDDHPDFWAGEPIKRQDGTEHEKVGDERAFVPLQQTKALPMRNRPLLGQVLHCYFGRTRGMQAFTTGSRSFA